MSEDGNLTALLLPGMDGTGELLAALVARLSLYRPVQVIAYPTQKPLGYDDLVDFVVSRPPKERFVIVGESFSGPIAIEIAASLSRVAGLVLETAAPYCRNFAGKFIFGHRLGVRCARANA